MSPSEVEAVCRRWLEDFWVQGNPDIVDELVHPECRSEDLDIPISVTVGREKFREYQQLMVHAFSGREMLIEEVLALEDRAAVRYKFSGTHVGKIYGIPPKGGRIMFRGTLFAHFKDGLFYRAFNQWDRFGSLAQMGALRPL